MKWRRIVGLLNAMQHLKQFFLMLLLLTYIVLLDIVLELVVIFFNKRRMQSAGSGDISSESTSVDTLFANTDTMEAVFFICSADKHPAGMFARAHKHTQISGP